MKSVVKKISFLAFVMILFAASMLAQNGEKIIAVVNKADWCHVCKANGEKIRYEVMPVFKKSRVLFMMNDLTDETTKDGSKKMLEEKKIFEAVRKIKSTGLILLVDAVTGKLLAKLSVAEPAEILIKTGRKQLMIEKM